ncbi:MAG: LON peptidase substrate-binding domain-containing protein [Proteobacteria bacterium]|nr:LON peptidase substrate-binding domain-containing protein [Pseudomonadota bacterium]
MSVFDPSFEELNETVPIFPLPGVLLLPGGYLPLNIFEPRYITMTNGALAGDRIIGMVQPIECSDPAENPQVYGTGCAGRIVSFEETNDGRYQIKLKGTARFDIIDELEIKDGYRRVRANWQPYAHDLDEDQSVIPDRPKFLTALKKYFGLNHIDANWDAIEDAPCDRLVTSVAMICPFEPSEKQALLQASTLSERIEILATLVDMAIMSCSETKFERQ